MSNGTKVISLALAVFAAAVFSQPPSAYAVDYSRKNAQDLAFCMGMMRSLATLSKERPQINRVRRINYAAEEYVTSRRITSPNDYENSERSGAKRLKRLAERGKTKRLKRSVRECGPKIQQFLELSGSQKIAGLTPPSALDEFAAEFARGFDLKPSCSISPVWKDKGIRADLEGYFFKPQLPRRYRYIGGYGTGSEDGKHCVIIARPPAAKAGNTRALLAPPRDWALIWRSVGSRARDHGSMWRGVPPNRNYVCVGSVAQTGFTKPRDPDYRCVRRDLVERVSASKLIWSDSGSQADEEITVLELPNTGAFVALKGRHESVDRFDVSAGLIAAAAQNRATRKKDAKFHKGRRKLIESGTLAAYVRKKKWCGRKVRVRVQSTDPDNFIGEKVNLQRMLGALRDVLKFECRKARELQVRGFVRDNRMYVGKYGASTAWQLEDR
ncbi:MAG: Vps62-related protein [Rhodospirillaceae bacterium]|nr:Vps62-related protein [Rhodospirillales bacterium]MBT5036833.1 Vps62-related protein [Rhodospirillaceae bacterium]MBT6221099.1 Vps62-related protein [Rhodospirillaceae bacterium]MBT6362244.1 Vps62-related protein [Rhodospirillaceae bacterium]MBT7487834.1 Vps62-related protein [Rhodospirillales bacterium]